MQGEKHYALAGSLDLNRGLTFDGSNITDSTLPKVLSLWAQETPQFPCPSRLALGNSRVTDAGLGALAKVPVYNLDLRGDQITDAGLKLLQQQHPELTWLRLDNTRITDAGLRHVAKLPNLIALGLAGDPITDAGLESLLPLKRQLRILKLGRNNGITDNGLRYVARMREVGEFELYDDQITDAGLAAITAEGIGGITLVLVSDRITDAGVRAAKPDAGGLEVGGALVSDGLLDELLSNPRRAGGGGRLDLRHNPIHGDRLKKVNESGVTSLSLRGTTDDDLKYLYRPEEAPPYSSLLFERPCWTPGALQRLKELGVLNLMLVNFREEDVEGVKSLPDLQSLYLLRPRARNAGLKTLARGVPASLGHLVIDGVDNEGLKHLAELTRRRYRTVTLYKPRISLDRLDELSRMSPNANVGFYVGAPAHFASIPPLAHHLRTWGDYHAQLAFDGGLWPNESSLLMMMEPGERPFDW